MHACVAIYVQVLYVLACVYVDELMHVYSYVQMCMHVRTCSLCVAMYLYVCHVRVCVYMCIHS